MVMNFLMISFIVAIGVGSAEEQVEILVEPAKSMADCATKRTNKIAGLRSGSDAKKYRSYQILCIQLQGIHANQVAMSYLAANGSGSFILQLDEPR